MFDDIDFKNRKPGTTADESDVSLQEEFDRLRPAGAGRPDFVYREFDYSEEFVASGMAERIAKLSEELCEIGLPHAMMITTRQEHAIDDDGDSGLSLANMVVSSMGAKPFGDMNEAEREQFRDLASRNVSVIAGEPMIRVLHIYAQMDCECEMIPKAVRAALTDAPSAMSKLDSIEAPDVTH